MTSLVNPVRKSVKYLSLHNGRSRHVLHNTRFKLLVESFRPECEERRHPGAMPLRELYARTPSSTKTRARGRREWGCSKSGDFGNPQCHWHRRVTSSRARRHNTGSKCTLCVHYYLCAAPDAKLSKFVGQKYLHPANMHTHAVSAAIVHTSMRRRGSGSGGGGGGRTTCRKCCTPDTRWLAFACN